MDNYIVRIYRREKDNPRVLVGLVEEVGEKGKRAFNDLEDLWEILNDGKRALNSRKKQAAGMKRVVHTAENKKQRSNTK